MHVLIERVGGVINKAFMIYDRTTIRIVYIKNLIHQITIMSEFDFIFRGTSSFLNVKIKRAHEDAKCGNSHRNQKHRPHQALLGKNYVSCEEILLF